MFFKRTKQKNIKKLVAIFDIGSASVGAALVVLSPKAPPQIVYTLRKSMVFQKNLDVHRLTASMLDTLRSVAETLQKEGVVHAGMTQDTKKQQKHSTPLAIVCVYSSAWFVSYITTANASYTKPVTVTSELIETLTQQASKKANKKTNTDNVPIEQHSIDVTLNGYSVEDPLGKKARHVILTVFESCVSRSLMERVEKQLGDVFHTHTITHHSLTLASFTVLRNLFGSVDDCVLIDISGELTDISVVRDSVLRDSASFPYGTNTLLRALSHTLKATSQETRSLLSLYHQRTIDVPTQKTIKHRATHETQQWVKELTTVLERFAQKTLLPRTLFLTAPKVLVEPFVAKLQESGFEQLLQTKNTFDVVPITVNTLRPFCVIHERAHNDVFLTLETLFLDHVLGGPTVK